MQGTRPPIGPGLPSGLGVDRCVRDGGEIGVEEMLQVPEFGRADPGMHTYDMSMQSTVLLHLWCCVGLRHWLSEFL